MLVYGGKYQRNKRNNYSGGGYHGNENFRGRKKVSNVETISSFMAEMVEITAAFNPIKMETIGEETAIKVMTEVGQI